MPCPQVIARFPLKPLPPHVLYDDTSLMITLSSQTSLSESGKSMKRILSTLNTVLDNSFPSPTYSGIVGRQFTDFYVDYSNSTMLFYMDEREKIDLQGFKEQCRLSLIVLQLVGGGGLYAKICPLKMASDHVNMMPKDQGNVRYEGFYP